MPKCFRMLAMGLLVLAMAGTARAQDDEDLGPDARKHGYRDAEGKLLKVELPPAGMGGTWALFVVMGVLCVGVMFKNGKRTHLD